MIGRIRKACFHLECSIYARQLAFTWKINLCQGIISIFSMHFMSKFDGLIEPIEGRSAPLLVLPIPGDIIIISPERRLFCSTGGGGGGGTPADSDVQGCSSNILGSLISRGPYFWV